MPNEECFTMPIPHSAALMLMGSDARRLGDEL